MRPESKRAVIAAVRRIVFSIFILLLAWEIIIALRGVAPASITNWSTSLQFVKPLAEIINPHLGITIQLMLFGSILGWVIAAVLLVLGVIISRVTDHHSKLMRIRTVLRLVLVSSGVSSPIFVTATILIAYRLIWTAGVPNGVDLASSLLVSFLPAWLLVQAGDGELANWTAKHHGSFSKLARRLCIRLMLMMLRLVGAIICVTVIVEVVSGQPGSGRLFLNAAYVRDFPVMFALAWEFAIIVVLVKLAADLIEITYNYFGGRYALEYEKKPQTSSIRIPKGWLIFCFTLVLLSVFAAVVGPVFAPHGVNEMDLTARLLPPSAEHILGVDDLGRDILSRLLFSLRYTLLPGLLSVAILFVPVAGWAILAAFLKKADNWLGDSLEDVLMLSRDAMCAFPWLVTGIMVMALVGPGFVQVALVGSMVLAPRALGVMREAYNSPIAGRGWLYSVLWSIPVMLIFAVGGGILLTSSLGFLGVGVPPPSPELGGTVHQYMQYMIQAPWMVLWPGPILALLLMVWIMAGDALIERLGFRSKAIWSKIVE